MWRRITKREVTMPSPTVLISLPEAFQPSVFTQWEFALAQSGAITALGERPDIMQEVDGIVRQEMEVSGFTWSNEPNLTKNFMQLLAGSPPPLQLVRGENGEAFFKTLHTAFGVLESRKGSEGLFKKIFSPDSKKIYSEAKKALERFASPNSWHFSTNPAGIEPWIGFGINAVLSRQPSPVVGFSELLIAADQKNSSTPEPLSGVSLISGGSALQAFITKAQWNMLLCHRMGPFCLSATTGRDETMFVSFDPSLGYAPPLPELRSRETQNVEIPFTKAVSLRAGGPEIEIPVLSIIASAKKIFPEPLIELIIMPIATAEKMSAGAQNMLCERAAAFVYAVLEWLKIDGLAAMTATHAIHTTCMERHLQGFESMPWPNKNPDLILVDANTKKPRPKEPMPVGAPVLVHKPELISVHEPAPMLAPLPPLTPPPLPTPSQRPTVPAALPPPLPHMPPPSRPNTTTHGAWVRPRPPAIPPPLPPGTKTLESPVLNIDWEEAFPVGLKSPK